MVPRRGRPRISISNGWLLRPGRYDRGRHFRWCDRNDGHHGLQRNTQEHVQDGALGWPGRRCHARRKATAGWASISFMSGDVVHQEQPIAAAGDIMGNASDGRGPPVHELRPTNDWSDPNVYIGAIQVGIDRVPFAFRTMPNAIGAHLHDEPGLTWLKNPHTGDRERPRYRAPARSLRASVWPRSRLVRPRRTSRTPTSMRSGREQNDFKLGLMDALLEGLQARLSLDSAGGFLPVTQSQYGWSAPL